MFDFVIFFHKSVNNSYIQDPEQRQASKGIFLNSSQTSSLFVDTVGESLFGVHGRFGLLLAVRFLNSAKYPKAGRM